MDRKGGAWIGFEMQARHGKVRRGMAQKGQAGEARPGRYWIGVDWHCRIGDDR